MNRFRCVGLEESPFTSIVFTCEFCQKVPLQVGLQRNEQEKLFKNQVILSNPPRSWI
jgi:hypothetical protein